MHRQARFLALGIDKGWRGCWHREEWPAVEHHPVHTLFHQQPVQCPLGLPLGEELRVTHFEGVAKRPRQPIDEGRQSGQPLWPETGGQLQGEQPQLVVQRGEQANKVGDLFVCAHQIALVADGLRKFEVETKVIGHRIGPALYRIGGRQGVEGGITLHRVEHGGVVGEVFGRLGAKAQQLAGPAGVGPLR